MLGKMDPKSSRVGWIILHGGLLGCGLLVWMWAEDQREGGPASSSNREHTEGDNEASARRDADNKQAEIQKQIARLRDPIYGVRAKAIRQLMAMGPQAIRPLAASLHHQDPDIRRQAQTILARLIRSDEECFAELEAVACSPNHPSAMVASGILQRECTRRVDVETAMIEQRKARALRFLREAREALSQGEFLKARQMVFAAEALKVGYQPVDDQPAFVLKAIERAEQRVTSSPRSSLITAERQ